MRGSWRCLWVAGWLALSLGCSGSEPPFVEAFGKTQPAGTNEPEDAALWVHPSDPEQSLVIASHADRGGGLALHELSGERRQFLELGEGIRSVDLRSGVALGGQRVSLVAAAQVGHRVSQVLFFRIDEAKRELVALPRIELPVSIPTLQALCFYRDAANDRLFVFAIEEGDEGRIEQWELRENGDGALTPELRRSFWIGGSSESCVADDERGVLFVAEKEQGIWRYEARPGGGVERREVDRVGGPSGLAADIEGLALYQGPNESGFLLASSEGNDRLVVYERAGEQRSIGSFRVRPQDSDEGLRGSEGIEVTSRPLGAKFPQGLLLVHDDHGEPEDNLALVSWEKVAEAIEADGGSGR